MSLPPRAARPKYHEPVQAKTLLVVLGGLAGVVVLHRVLLWAERRGFVHYRRRGSSGALGNAMLELQAILEPAKRHVIEERLRDPAEDAEAGDPPGPRAAAPSGARGARG